MQFLPATFEQYAVDGDHDGRLDVYDPADAITAAAGAVVEGPVVLDTAAAAGLTTPPAALQGGGAGPRPDARAAPA